SGQSRVSIRAIPQNQASIKTIATENFQPGHIGTKAKHLLFQPNCVGQTHTIDIKSRQENEINVVVPRVSHDFLPEFLNGRLSFAKVVSLAPDGLAAHLLKATGESIGQRLAVGIGGIAQNQDGTRAQCLVSKLTLRFSLSCVVRVDTEKVGANAVE